ncbi:MAG: DNA adenine methylase [Nitrospinae bacterium]|nr:DNA adenine methylase [Nitrospinota bacterium]
MAKPFFAWVGGKARLANRILPIYPNHKCYVEVFAGAGALFFLKEPAKVEVLNDINKELVNLYRVVQHHLEEFCKQFKWALVSRTMYDWLKMSKPETLTDIQRAARFYYLQKTSFGGKVGKQNFGYSTTSPSKLNLLRIEEELSQAHLRLARGTVENLDWKTCVEKYDRPHTLFYMDPPYYKVDKGFYGMNLTLDDYRALADSAKRIQGKCVISVSDMPEMRTAFEGLAMKSVPINYTVGSYKGLAAARRELIIHNW